MKYRITEIFLFFCIFGDRDGDSIVGIKQKNKQTNKQKQKQNQKQKQKQKQN